MTKPEEVMPTGVGKDARVTVLISSFDGFRECWPAVCHSFEKYWPDCPFAVRLMTNEVDFSHPAVETIRVPGRKPWSDGMISAMEEISSPFVLYFQEDYWLTHRVNTARILEYADLSERESLNYLRFLSKPRPNAPYPKDARLGILSDDAPYRTSCQVALWRSNVLRELLLPRESAWDFERLGSQRSSRYGSTFLSVWNKDTDDYFHGVRYLCSAINQGRWGRGAHEYAKREGLSIDFSTRSTETWWHEFLRTPQGIWLKKWALRFRLLLSSPRVFLEKAVLRWDLGGATKRLHTWRRRGWRDWMIVVPRHLVPGARRTARLRGGMKLSVRLADELAPTYLLGQEFEPETVSFLEGYLRPGDVVLDIGANIGHLTIVAATAVGSTGRVLAFEPSPQEYRELTRNVSLNSLRNVEPLALAVSETSGIVPFYLAGDGLGIYNSTGKPFRSSNVRIIEVPSVGLDAFLDEKGLERATLVKMDVEGGELAAIKGGERLFSQPNAPVVVCEFSDVAGKATGQTGEQLWNRFEELGYVLYEFWRRSAGQLTLRKAKLQPHYDYENLVAVKPCHIERLRSCGLLPTVE